MARQQRALEPGIIGCGRVAEERHLPALRHLRDAVGILTPTATHEEIGLAALAENSFAGTSRGTALPVP